MNEEQKVVEPIEREAKQDEIQSELTDQDLDNVAGGTKINGSRSNIKSNLT